MFKSSQRGSTKRSSENVAGLESSASKEKDKRRTILGFFLRKKDDPSKSSMSASSTSLYSSNSSLYQQPTYHPHPDPDASSAISSSAVNLRNSSSRPPHSQSHRHSDAGLTPVSSFKPQKKKAAAPLPPPSLPAPSGNRVNARSDGTNVVASPSGGDFRQKSHSVQNISSYDPERGWLGGGGGATGGTQGGSEQERGWLGGGGGAPGGTQGGSKQDEESSQNKQRNNTSASEEQWSPQSDQSHYSQLSPASCSSNDVTSSRTELFRVSAESLTRGASVSSVTSTSLGLSVREDDDVAHRLRGVAESSNEEVEKCTNERNTTDVGSLLQSDNLRTRITVTSSSKSRATNNNSSESLNVESTNVALSPSQSKHSSSQVDVRSVGKVESSERQGNGSMNKELNRMSQRDNISSNCDTSTSTSTEAGIGRLTDKSGSENSLSGRTSPNQSEPVRTSQNRSEPVRTSGHDGQRNGLPPAAPRRVKRKAPPCPTAAVNIETATNSSNSPLRPCQFIAPPPPDTPPPSGQTFEDDVVGNATSSVFFSYFSSLDPISSMIFIVKEDTTEQGSGSNVAVSHFGGQVSLTRQNSLSSEVSFTLGEDEMETSEIFFINPNYEQASSTTNQHEDNQDQASYITNEQEDKKEQSSYSTSPREDNNEQANSKTNHQEPNKEQSSSSTSHNEQTTYSSNHHEDDNDYTESSANRREDNNDPATSAINRLEDYNESDVQDRRDIVNIGVSNLAQDYSCDNSAASTTIVKAEKGSLHSTIPKSSSILQPAHSNSELSSDVSNNFASVPLKSSPVHNESNVQETTEVDSQSQGAQNVPSSHKLFISSQHHPSPSVIHKSQKEEDVISQGVVGTKVLDEHQVAFVDGTPEEVTTDKLSPGNVLVDNFSPEIVTPDHNVCSDSQNSPDLLAEQLLLTNMHDSEIKTLSCAPRSDSSSLSGLEFCDSTDLHTDSVFVSLPLNDLTSKQDICNMATDIELSSSHTHEIEHSDEPFISKGAADNKELMAVHDLTETNYNADIDIRSSSDDLFVVDSVGDLLKEIDAACSLTKAEMINQKTDIGNENNDNGEFHYQIINDSVREIANDEKTKVKKIIFLNESKHAVEVCDRGELRLDADDSDEDLILLPLPKPKLSSSGDQSYSSITTVPRNETQNICIVDIQNSRIGDNDTSVEGQNELGVAEHNVTDHINHIVTVDNECIQAGYNDPSITSHIKHVADSGKLIELEKKMSIEDCAFPNSDDEDEICLPIPKRKEQQSEKTTGSPENIDIQVKQVFDAEDIDEPKHILLPKLNNSTVEPDFSESILSSSEKLLNSPQHEGFASSRIKHQDSWSNQVQRSTDIDRFTSQLQNENRSQVDNVFDNGNLTVGRIDDKSEQDVVRCPIVQSSMSVVLKPSAAKTVKTSSIVTTRSMSISTAILTNSDATLSAVTTVPTGTESVAEQEEIVLPLPKRRNKSEDVGNSAEQFKNASENQLNNKFLKMKKESTNDTTENSKDSSLSGEIDDNLNRQQLKSSSDNYCLEEPFAIAHCYDNIQPVEYHDANQLINNTETYQPKNICEGDQHKISLENPESDEIIKQPKSHRTSSDIPQVIEFQAENLSSHRKFHSNSSVDKDVKNIENITSDVMPKSTCQDSVNLNNEENKKSILVEASQSPVDILFIKQSFNAPLGNTVQNMEKFKESKNDGELSEAVSSRHAITKPEVVDQDPNIDVIFSNLENNSTSVSLASTNTSMLTAPENAIASNLQPQNNLTKTQTSNLIATNLYSDISDTNKQSTPNWPAIEQASKEQHSGNTSHNKLSQRERREKKYRAQTREKYFSHETLLSDKYTQESPQSKSEFKSTDTFSSSDNLNDRKMRKRAESMIRDFELSLEEHEANTKSEPQNNSPSFDFFFSLPGSGTKQKQEFEKERNLRPTQSLPSKNKSPNTKHEAKRTRSLVTTPVQPVKELNENELSKIDETSKYSGNHPTSKSFESSKNKILAVEQKTQHIKIPQELSVLADCGAQPDSSSLLDHATQPDSVSVSHHSAQPDTRNMSDVGIQQNSKIPTDYSTLSNQTPQTDHSPHFDLSSQQEPSSHQKNYRLSRKEHNSKKVINSQAEPGSLKRESDEHKLKSKTNPEQKDIDSNILNLSETSEKLIDEKIPVNVNDSKVIKIVPLIKGNLDSLLQVDQSHLKVNLVNSGTTPPAQLHSLTKDKLRQSNDRVNHSKHTYSPRAQIQQGVERNELESTEVRIQHSAKPQRIPYVIVRPIKAASDMDDIFKSGTSVSNNPNKRDRTKQFVHSDSESARIEAETIENPNVTSKYESAVSRVSINKNGSASLNDLRSTEKLFQISDESNESSQNATGNPPVHKTAVVNVRQEQTKQKQLSRKEIKIEPQGSIKQTDLIITKKNLKDEEDEASINDNVQKVSIVLKSTVSYVRNDNASAKMIRSPDGDLKTSNVPLNVDQIQVSSKINKHLRGENKAVENSDFEFENSRMEIKPMSWDQRQVLKDSSDESSREKPLRTMSIARQFEELARSAKKPLNVDDISPPAQLVRRTSRLNSSQRSLEDITADSHFISKKLAVEQPVETYLSDSERTRASRSRSKSVGTPDGLVSSREPASGYGLTSATESALEENVQTPLSDQRKDEKTKIADQESVYPGNVGAMSSQGSVGIAISHNNQSNSASDIANKKVLPVERKPSITSQNMKETSARKQVVIIDQKLVETGHNNIVVSSSSPQTIVSSSTNLAVSKATTTSKFFNVVRRSSMQTDRNGNTRGAFVSTVNDKPRPLVTTVISNQHTPVTSASDKPHPLITSMNVSSNRPIVSTVNSNQRPLVTTLDGNSPPIGITVNGNLRTGNHNNRHVATIAHTRPQVTTVNSNSAPLVTTINVPAADRRDSHDRSKTMEIPDEIHPPGTILSIASRTAKFLTAASEKDQNFAIPVKNVRLSNQPTQQSRTGSRVHTSSSSPARNVTVLSISTTTEEETQTGDDGKMSEELLWAKASLKSNKTNHGPVSLRLHADGSTDQIVRTPRTGITHAAAATGRSPPTH